MKNFLAMSKTFSKASIYHIQGIIKLEKAFDRTSDH